MGGDSINANAANAVFELPDSARFYYKFIDDEHQKLVDVVNAIMLGFSRESAMSGEEFFVHVSEFSRHLQRHFDHEEQEMADAGFPELAEHKVCHAASIATVDAIAKRAKTQPVVSKRQAFALFDQLIGEFLRDDLPFLEYLDGKGVLGK